MQSDGRYTEDRKQRESKIAHLCEMIADSNEQESELDKLVALMEKNDAPAEQYIRLGIERKTSCTLCERSTV